MQIDLSTAKQILTYLEILLDTRELNNSESAECQSLVNLLRTFIDFNTI